MNQDWEEKRIKDLFNELRERDEPVAPPFATVWESALSRIERTGRPKVAFRAVIAASALILLCVSLFIFFTQRSKQANPIEAPGPEALAAQPQPIVPMVTPPKKVNAPPKLARRPASTRLRQSDLLISRWQSPTDFLLDPPGEQVSKSVPRLNDSIVQVKALIPDERRK